MGNCPRWYLGQPKGFKMRLSEDYRKCVAYLGNIKESHSGERDFVLQGTGFFVSVNATINRNLSFVYLVTAAHVAERIDGTDAFLRVNQKSGNSINVHLTQDMTWYYHPTDNYADVAVLPLHLDLSNFDYKIIQSDNFLTDTIIESEGIGVGDDVAMIGLFSKVTGNNTNLPIVRKGSIAMLPPPDERVPIGWIPKRSIGAKGDTECYLIEVRSIGGLSGAPIVCLKEYIGIKTDENEPVPAIGHKIYLLGLMHGHWNLDSKNLQTNSMDELASDETGNNEPINLGIAIVTPAKKIIETLAQPILVEKRRLREDAIRFANAPVPDELSD